MSCTHHRADHCTRTPIKISTGHLALTISGDTKVVLACMDEYAATGNTKAHSCADDDAKI
jgi:hypothetical protein